MTMTLNEKEHDGQEDEQLNAALKRYDAEATARACIEFSEPGGRGEPSLAMTLNELLEVWYQTALAFLGDRKGALHLTGQEYEQVNAALKEHGAEATARACIEFSEPGGRGEPSLAIDWWPAGDYYLVEVDVTSELYLALVKALRSCWKGMGHPRPPELGQLGSAAGLAQLWRQEKGRDRKGAFERCRDRVVQTKQAWRTKMERYQARKRGGTRRVPSRLPVRLPVRHDYRIVHDWRENRISAYFAERGFSSAQVAYGDNDRLLHDLIVKTQRGGEQTLTYDQLATGLGLGCVPSKMLKDDRAKPCRDIRTIISRFNRKWLQVVTEALDRLKEADSAKWESCKNQGPPLETLGRGVWRIAVEFEVRKERGA
jgi:hypothetical protein